MTDPVNSVSGTRGTNSGGTYSGGGFTEDRKKRKVEVQKTDLIEISQDARDIHTAKDVKGYSNI
jgi:hypothetical protein